MAVAPQPVPTSAASLKIDFVSDVSCPWCVIGLKSLEQALQHLEGEVAAEIHIQPFELNPDMPPEGCDSTEYLKKKYGSVPEQFARNREALHARGKELGFEFGRRDRIYNSFDAHRLLHWAGLEGRQRPLKHALFHAYFTDSEHIGAHDVLVRCAVEVGLSEMRAREILSSDTYASEVRAQERFYLEHGIHAVPAVIVNDRHLISGGQPVEVFESALREIAGKN